MKPFLTGRARVSLQPLESIAAASKEPAPIRIAGHTHVGDAGGGAAGKNQPEPTVECIRQGDKIARIIVTCGCGERIEIECLYPAGG